MDNERSNPPSDEIMGKVVAKWKGWDFIHLLNHEDCDGKYWDDDIVYGPYSCPLFHQYKKDAAHDLTGFVFDPRVDTDAALELLGWLCDEMERQDGNSRYIIKRDNEWQVHEHSPIYCDHIVPLSGEPFRRTVCWLAADVLGVTNA
jgi:hypothetical protein